MSFGLSNTDYGNLMLLKGKQPSFVIELCKTAFDYLTNGHLQRCEYLAKKCDTNIKTIQNIVDGLIELLIHASRTNCGSEQLQLLQLPSVGLSEETINILSQFVESKRNFINNCVKSATLRSYRIVNIEWRLEARIASRSLMSQCNVFITMKLYLHTEPKNENRDLLQGGENEVIHPNERKNRKDIIVQTDLNSLSYMIRTLEDALIESKSRRIRNIVNAIH